MYDFFKNIAEINACTFVGACSIHPSVSALYQIILNEIREISFYLVKLNEFKIKDKEAMDIAITGLSVFFINTSFNQKKYLNFIYKLFKIKNRVKETYMHFCAKNDFPCEVIKINFEFDEKMSVTELIHNAQNNLINKQKNIDIAKKRLFELITLCVRLFAIDVVKIKKLDKNFDEFDFEILRFFSLTNSYSIRNEKIIRRIKQFSDFSLKIIEKLQYEYKTRYGEKENIKTTTNLSDGHCILVSGDDFIELEKLLKTLDELNYSEEDISVYTHGPLFLAHFYPYFKNNRFLKGHFGSDDVEYDFSVFSGSILITQNFIQKIDSLYRGEIYSNKIISFSKVTDIENDNYKPVIDSAMKLDCCRKTTDKSDISIVYNKDRLNSFFDKNKTNDIIIVSGKIDENEEIETYKDKTIISVNCAYENELLFKFINKIKDKNINVELFLAQCNLSSLRALFALLGQDIKLHIANCPHSLINPHVIESLKKDFNVQIIKSLN